jgi:hypothetical protein
MMPEASLLDISLRLKIFFLFVTVSIAPASIAFAAKPASFFIGLILYSLAALNKISTFHGNIRLRKR